MARKLMLLPTVALTMSLTTVESTLRNRESGGDSSSARAKALSKHQTTLPTIDTDGYSVRPDPNSSHGVWEGWGTSLAWWANAFGDRDDLADAIFTMDSTDVTTASGDTVNVPGLGMNIARYNAGGCSWNSINGESMVESANIPKFKQIESFWLDWYSNDTSSSSWDWSVDANQRAMLEKAKKRGADNFDLFSNSPVWWALYNHNPSGSPTGYTDNLQSWNYANHALYMASVAAHFKDEWDLTFNYVEPFNEPIATWWPADGTQEGCHFEHSTQSTVLPLLRDALDGLGLSDTLIASSDESTYTMARDTLRALSDDAKTVIDKVNVHGYEYEDGPRDQVYDEYTKLDTSKVKLYNSEYGDGDASGLSLARNFALDIEWLHPTAWVYWQVLDGGGWGCLDSTMEGDSKGVDQVNPKWYRLAQYTRHLRAGMTVIEVDHDDTVAFYDSAAQTLTLVTTVYDIANGGSTVDVTHDLGAFSEAAGPIVCWTTSTGTSPYQLYEGPIEDQTLDSEAKFTASFGPNTTTTFVVHGVVV